MDEFADIASAQQQLQDRFSASSSPADMHRPRRHLPSPALAQATSLLKLTQSYGSFDISELSGLHLSLTSSPSAPVVSSSGLIGPAGRKLPVPGRAATTTTSTTTSATTTASSSLANQQQHKMSSSGHFSQSDLLMAGVADAMDEMDALIRSGSSAMSGGGGTVSSSSNSVRDSPKLSLSSRKLPVPPVSSKVLNQSRRLLPRPLSCDVPCVSDAADLTAQTSTTTNTSTYLSLSQQQRSTLLCRPFSFDYSSGVEAELEEAALLQHHGSASNSDPSLLLFQDLQGRRSLVRQSSTTSCPALVRPCALSPRSPKYRTDGSYNGSSGGGGSGGSSINTTPSPLPLIMHQSLSTDPAAYVPTGILVPFMTPPALPTTSPLPPSSGSSVGPARPYPWSNPPTTTTTAAETVIIPSAGSAFRAPLLSQQHRQASLSLPPSSATFGVGASSTTTTSLDPATALALRRHRYHDVGDGSGSLCGSMHHATEFSHFRLDMQRPSRSRQPVRNSVALAGR